MARTPSAPPRLLGKIYSGPEPTRQWRRKPGQAAVRPGPHVSARNKEKGREGDGLRAVESPSGPKWESAGPIKVLFFSPFYFLFSFLS
jgi:hypothetical protein